MQIMRKMRELDMRAGELLCRKVLEHDHEYIDDPPTLTELVRLEYLPRRAVKAVEPNCSSCGGALQVEHDGTELYVSCESDHEVSSTREVALWEAALTSNGYARVCVNWWEQLR